MAKYIDWYLVEAEGLLRGRLRRDRLHEVLSEAEAHLRDGAEDLVSHGMSAEDAELAAIERFGRVRAFVSDVSGYGEKSLAPRLIVSGAFLFIFILCIYLTVLSAGGKTLGSAAHAAYAGAISCCLLLFLGGSLFGRRWHGKLVLGTCLCACGLGFFAGAGVGARAAFVGRDNQISEYQAMGKVLALEHDRVLRGSAAFGAAAGSDLREFRAGNYYLVPWLIPEGASAVSSEWRKTEFKGDKLWQFHVGYEEVATLEEAKRTWRDVGPQMAARLRDARGEAQRLADSDRRLTINNDYVREGFYYALVAVADSLIVSFVLVLFQGLVTLPLRPRSWLRRRLA